MAIPFLFIFFAFGANAVENKKDGVKDIVQNYRVYSLARCITNNYKEMGVDFKKLPIKDNTMGFIDIDNGLALSVDSDNSLDAFIKNKTGNYYQPKQHSGDLAAINLVVYDCIAFYQSSELGSFLKQLIEKNETE